MLKQGSDFLFEMQGRTQNTRMRGGIRAGARTIEYGVWCKRRKPQGGIVWEGVSPSHIGGPGEIPREKIWEMVVPEKRF